MKAWLRAPAFSDFEAIASWISDAHACSRWAGPQVPFPFAPEQLPHLLNVTESNSFCLSSDNYDLLGFGQCFDKGNGLARLARVIVSPVYRGQGLGSALCQALMQQAAATIKPDAFSLGVYIDNPAAITVYSRLGFSVTDDNTHPDRLNMTLRANPSIQGTPEKLRFSVPSLRSVAPDLER